VRGQDPEQARRRRRTQTHKKASLPEDAERWDARYREGNTPWDLGRPPPALLGLLEELVEETLSVLVPGAGHGRDAIAWAAAGHEVTALDHAPTALESCRRQSREAGVHLRVVLADVRHLPHDLDGQFDAVWEQTCFCALQPTDRQAYAAMVSRALRPGGVFYGLFWKHGGSGGPPFDVTEACVRATFDRCFQLLALRPVTSLPHRGCEFLAIMRRRGRR